MRSRKVVYSSKALMHAFPLVLAGVVATAAIAAGGRTTQSQYKFGRKTTEAPIAARGKFGQDLFLAIDHGDMASVKSLLAEGADPDSRNGLEFTPLYMAAASHQTDVMRLLLKAGATVDAKSPYGTPLMFACASANVEGAHLLISLGADVNVKRSDGTTPLMMASAIGATPTVQELLNHHADVQAKDVDDATALTLAARAGHEDVGAVLLKAGAAADRPDAELETPLMVAAANGHAKFVRLLLSSGANPNRRDSEGRTALILAADYCDNPEVVRALLGAGANPKATDAAGRTAAAAAMARGHLATLPLLGGPKSPAVSALPTPRDAAQRGLKTLQASMAEFHEMTSCVSCHHEGLGRIATASLREHGFAVDNGVQKAEMEAVNAVMTGMQPLHEQALKNPEVMKQVPLIEINEVATTDTWLLAGMAAQKQPPTRATAAMALVLARQQMPDGHWGFSGPREPMQSSFFTFTALAVRSLNTYAPASHSAETASQLAKAKSWLMSTPTKNSEDRAFRLLGLEWISASRAERKQAIADILADQRPDGGWSQLPDMQSDAYATGQALYALRTAGGIPASEPVYRRGVLFLLRTQDRDGSWFVNKRTMPNNNYFDCGFPHGESQYASFNGTCWATMALAEAR